QLTVTLSATHGALTLSPDTLSALTFTLGDGSADAAMAFSGSQTSLNSALATLRFDPVADYNGPATLTFVTDDGLAAPATRTTAIPVEPVNDAPLLLTSRPIALFDEPEDSAAPVGPVGTPVARLVDSTVSPGGADNVTDDNPQLGIAVTGTDPTGTWYFSLD